MVRPRVLIVPGLRGEVPEHWQSLLAEERSDCETVPALGRNNLSCEARVNLLEQISGRSSAPIVLVAHSGGVIAVAHWAMRTRRKVMGALLATPADMETPMPATYPTMDELQEGGWLPLPCMPLPFPAIVVASRNDPLCSFGRCRQLAQDWCARLVDAGEVGHLNPASGFGPWPAAGKWLRELGLEQGS